MSCRDPIVSKVLNHNVKGLYSGPITKKEATILCELGNLSSYAKGERKAYTGLGDGVRSDMNALDHVHL